MYDRLIAGPQPARLSISRPDPSTATIRLTVVLVMTCLVLQRFALPIGESFTSIVGPVCYVIVGYGVVRGLLVFDKWRLALWLLLAALSLTGAAIDMFTPPPFVVPLSVNSGLQMLFVSGFATFSFKHPVEERRLFQAINGCFAFIAIAGLLQFGLQFAGLAVFHFSDVVPPRYLTEYLTGGGYNNQIPISYGSNIFKSNGFFLAEPSVFSQMMAIAIAIEAMSCRRPAFFLLFILGLLASVSGTGWIVLAIFFVTAALTMGGRGIALVAGTAAAFGVVLLIWAAAFPQLFDAVVTRSGETSEVGSSGYIRFVTPFLIAHEILSRAPTALLYGVGFGVSERVPLPMEANVNSPMKIALESGIPALIFYVLMLTVGQQTPNQLRLIPPILALLFITGAYAQFAPVMFPMVIIMSVAVLHRTAADRPSSWLEPVRT